MFKINNSNNIINLVFHRFLCHKNIAIGKLFAPFCTKAKKNKNVNKTTKITSEIKEKKPKKNAKIIIPVISTNNKMTANKEEKDEIKITLEKKKIKFY